MPIGIDPKVDFAFKLVFGSPDHTAVTIHFLNAVLVLPEPISEVEILNPIKGKDRSEEKMVVLDVLAEDRIGRKFNIEMQTTLPLDLPQRLTYYGCLNLVRQLGSGDGYYLLRPSISICVLSRNLFPSVEDYHLSFRLRCDQQPLVFTDALEFHTLELPKFQPASDNIGSWSAIEKWLYFLQHAENMEARELSTQLDHPAFAEAVGVLEMISRSPEDRQFYEDRQKFLHDEQARLLAARQEGHQQGHDEGREEGREEGLLRGEIIGQLRMLEELLGENATPKNELVAMDQGVLFAKVEELRQRLRARQNG